ncbi:septum formation family protein [Nocardioides bizhenqiangii]|uniref:Septum formation family protein n=1 Tax=Nocardioides bizhenqiangii TaxID=3095076 RepID=A0ABZ0ZVH1_9ACTN|nr:MULTISPECIES: septum formation family protein [unclassified Nocardioides]MDZ5623256.1 septum formation family protein [Nocardioides sp. HM23]WQQ28227.1 septum formation family protein [Nocardioides sp. HM61]
MTERVVRRRAAAVLLAVAVGLTAFAGCSGTDEEDPTAPGTTTAPAPRPTAGTPPRPPEEGACYALSFRQALAPTTTRKPTPCGGPHTSETYAVGTLDTVVDGHLLAVDSDRVQEQVADRCPDALAPFLGGDQADLRLSMIRPVWFTPSLAQSDRGADWYRCDVVVIAGDMELAEPDGSLQGALDEDEVRDRYAMCGTAAPDDEDFERVICAAEHSWRAIQVVPYEPGSYPGEETVRDRLTEPCENAGLDVADDPLDYEWGYEYPTEEQWEMGQTWGLCWAPD